MLDILVQIVCIDHQQTTKLAAGGQRVKGYLLLSSGEFFLKPSTNSLDPDQTAPVLL